MGGWTYDSGQFNLYCDVCKRKIKAEEAKHRWDGFIVCPEDWEPRQPQDFVKAKIDKIAVPFSRPTEDTSNDITYGMFDVATFKDTVVIVGIQHYKLIQETYQVTDSIVPPVIGRYLNFGDSFGIADQSEFSFAAYTYPDDAFDVGESGWISMNDYVEPTYFLEEYVGLKFVF